MTPRQVELARHALGLKQGQKRSYRNHFVVGDYHDDHADWMTMVDTGDALRREKMPHCGGDDCFWLTLQGARKAVRQGESLSSEDFPN